MTAEKSEPVKTKVLEIPGVGPAIAVVVTDESSNIATCRVAALDRETTEATVEAIKKDLGAGKVREISAKNSEGQNSSSTIFDARRWGGCNWQPKGPTKIQ